MQKMVEIYVMNWYLAMLLSEIVNEEVNAFVLSILHKVAKKIFRLKLTSTIVHPKNDFVETSVTILLLVFVVACLLRCQLPFLV